MRNKLLLQKKLDHKQLKSKTKQMKKKLYLEQNISNHKLDRSDQKQNT